MTRLAIRPYCQNCSYIDPDIEIRFADGEVVDVEIRCKNADLCDGVAVRVVEELQGVITNETAR